MLQKINKRWKMPSENQNIDKEVSLKFQNDKVYYLKFITKQINLTVGYAQMKRKLMILQISQEKNILTDAQGEKTETREKSTIHDERVQHL